MTELTNKQQKFVDEYLIDLNGTQAAIRAGYSPRTAKVIARENLSKPYLKAYIDQRMADRVARTEITQDKVLQELAKIAFDDMKNYLEYRTEKVYKCDDADGKPVFEYKTVVDLKDSATVDTRNVAEISTGKDGVFKFKLYCKDNALVQLGKHLGLFKEQVDVNLNIVPEEKVKEIEQRLFKPNRK